MFRSYDDSKCETPPEYGSGLMTPKEVEDMLHDMFLDNEERLRIEAEEEEACNDEPEDFDMAEDAANRAADALDDVDMLDAAEEE